MLQWRWVARCVEFGLVVQDDALAGRQHMLILTLDGLVPLTSFLTAQYLGKEEDENEDD